MPWQIQTNSNREGQVTKEELLRDKDQIIAQLQQLQGALAYVQQKIAAIEKLDEGKNSKPTKKPEKAEA